MDEESEERMYQLLKEKLYERCQEVQLENERLVFRTNGVKKMVQKCGRDIELLKRRLDRYNDNWRSLPMVLPHPKRKIEQKRGPKPKPKQVGITITSVHSTQNEVKSSLEESMEALKKARKQRVRRADKESGMQPNEATLLRQQQQQKRQELQKQRQREQQAMKLAAQQQRQLLRQQKQMAAQQLKQQRQLQRQQQRINMQQHKKQTVPTAAVPANISVSTITIPPEARFVTKVSTTFLTPQRSAQHMAGDVIMPPPPPPPKVEHYTDQQAHVLLMHRPLQVIPIKNPQKPKIP